MVLAPTTVLVEMRELFIASRGPANHSHVRFAEAGFAPQGLQSGLADTLTTPSRGCEAEGQQNKLGNYHCNNRVYSIQAGRWLSPDQAVSPWWNLSDYAGQRVTHASDPSGLGTSIYTKVEDMSETDKSYAAPGSSAAGEDDEVEEWHNKSIRTAERPEDGRKDDLMRWQQRKAVLRSQLDTIKLAAKNADCCICPEWLIAVWWDERVRMGTSEQEWDDTGDGVGRNTSTGAFQMQGSAAHAAVKWSGRYNDKFKKMTGDELQDEMQSNFNLASHIAADRMCMILEGYRNAGWNPCDKNAINSAQLIGTLWSRGVGKPNNNPKSIKRGDQIAKWAEEAKAEFGLPDCNCDCEPFVKKK